MKHAVGLLACVVLGLLAALVSARAAHADDFETALLDRQFNLASPYRVRARVLSTPAGNRAGGYGYARIELINPTDKAHDLLIEVHPGWGHRNEQCSFRKTVHLEPRRLEPSSRIWVELPLLNARYGMTLSFTLDGRRSGDNVRLGGPSRGRGNTLSALLIGNDLGAWQGYLTQELRGAGRRGRSVVDARIRSASQLPSGWQLLSGFDLVVVDFAASGLNAERQQTLVRYVASGGNLVVARMDADSSGPLADMCRQRATVAGDGAKGRHGLGRWIWSKAAPERRTTPVEDWLRESWVGAPSIIERVREAHTGGAPAALWLPLMIPGLGEVPTGVFFLLILLFVVLVGPVSYIYFRRKRRLAMLLVTIPVAGFLCTAAILAYGLFSEGFGIIGSTRSFTVLDQETHVASTTAGKTLYAGLQPGSLDPGPDSFVVCASFLPENDSSGARSVLHVNLDAGHRIAGGILPSRAPTPFITSTVGRSRERLRFRRRPDGGYDVLAAPGYAPVSQPGAVLLHTKEGGYYLSVAAGHLAPMQLDAEELREHVAAVAEALSDMPVGAGEIVGSNYWGPDIHFRSRLAMEALARATTPLEFWILMQTGDMPPGSYLARVTRPPLREELGLDVTYRSEEHVVLGLLGAEDVIDE